MSAFQESDVHMEVVATFAKGKMAMKLKKNTGPTSQSML
jgi:hypothetical protein